MKSVGAGNIANNGGQAITGSFSESAILDCCSSGSGGNSDERAQGQSALQLFFEGESFAALFGAQQLVASVVLDLSQQDFFAAGPDDFLHWQPLPVPQPPQQALAVETVMQPAVWHDAVQSNDCPSTVLNMVSTSKAAIGERSELSIGQTK